MHPETIVLALDLGEKRWGVAIGASDTGFASPLPFIDAQNLNAAIEGLRSIARSEGVGLLLVGLPLDAKGRPGPKARLVLELAQEIAKKLKLPLAFWDERMSTREASRALTMAGLRARKQKARIDSAAAALILSSFLRASPSIRKAAIAFQPEEA
ncbi:MAG: Holliday junction resolvase RuvX [Sandaracinaceae bacterium]|nr:Holliday junction resolvase RuvX [Sandaracinaceae bacterium]MDW8245770.1 Holliday junction resolvase RuvX [Sandaracinaceae bacterium]